MPAKPALSLLIIDDNPGSLELLSNALAQPDLEILTASDPEEGLDLLHERHPQIVLTDLVMPKMTGMEVLERIMEFDPSTDVILMTAHYSTESAVEAIKKGASRLPQQAGLHRRAAGTDRQAGGGRRKRRRAMPARRTSWRPTAEFEGIIGHSPLMWEMFSRIRRVAPHYRTVLVTGRDRHRQGSGGAGAAPAEPGSQRPLRGAELLRRGGDAV